MIKGPVVRMQTGNLLRDEISHDYAGSVRLWGLVNGNLMWDWEIADQEGNLHKHASRNCANLIHERRFAGHRHVRFPRRRHRRRLRRKLGPYHAE